MFSWSAYGDGQLYHSASLYDIIALHIKIRVSFSNKSLVLPEYAGKTGDTDMIHEMRTELAELASKLARKSKLDSMLKKLKCKEQELILHEQDLKASLSKEEADVERLEKITATSLFYSILGKKGAALDKEQQEAYAVRLKYSAAAAQLEDCRKQIEELSWEKGTLASCARRYDQVFARLKELLRENPDYAERLCGLERELGESESQLKELDEAIRAGNAAIQQIESIEKNLESAESWGTWDLVGGGLVSDLAKHSHLDEAQGKAEHLQVLLNRFQTELADVHVTEQLGAVNVEGFLRFADYFFDGLIADWSVLSHIHGSQESVSRIRQQVRETLSKLLGIRSARMAEKTVLENKIALLVSQTP